LCFAYKWLGEKKIHAHALPDYKDYKKDTCSDHNLAKELHNLFSEADVVVAHNGDNFDQKMANAMFARHKLGPPSPYKTIDTLKVSRKNFKFPSHHLDSIGEQLHIGRKLKHNGFPLWLACEAGDPVAYKTMVKYNKK